VYVCLLAFSCCLSVLSNVRQWNIYNKAARRRQHNLQNPFTEHINNITYWSQFSSYTAPFEWYLVYSFPNTLNSRLSWGGLTRAFFLSLYVV
jgi:hypothetical protein